MKLTFPDHTIADTAPETHIEYELRIHAKYRYTPFPLVLCRYNMIRYIITLNFSCKLRVYTLLLPSFQNHCLIRIPNSLKYDSLATEQSQLVAPYIQWHPPPQSLIGRSPFSAKLVSSFFLPLSPPSPTLGDSGQILLVNVAECHACHSSGLIFFFYSTSKQVVEFSRQECVSSLCIVRE